MLDSTISDRLMAAAEKIDPGYLTAEDKEGQLRRARDRASNLRHLADLAKSHGYGFPSLTLETSLSLRLVSVQKRRAIEAEAEREAEEQRLFDTIKQAVEGTRSKTSRILLEVSKKHGVSVHDMKGPWRDRLVTAARQEAMHRMRHETSMSFPQISKIFGGRDHTTAMHAVKRHQARIDRGEA